MNKWIPIFVPNIVHQELLMDFVPLKTRKWTSLGDVCIQIAPKWRNCIQTHPKQSAATSLVFIEKNPQMQACAVCQNNLTRYVRLGRWSLTSSLKRGITKSVVLE